MAIDIFPSNGAPQRVTLPLPDDLIPLNGQVPSWRVVFSRETVPVFVAGDGNSQGADVDGFFPINAFYLSAKGCKPVGCEDVTIFLDDLMSRCTFVLLEATITPPNPTTVPTLQIVDYKIKGTYEGKGQTLAVGNFVVPVKGISAPYQRRSALSGIIRTVSGILVTQFEFWASVRNIAGAAPVEVRLEFGADRLGGHAFSWPGDISGGGDLPLICCTGPTGATGGK